MSSSRTRPSSQLPKAPVSLSPACVISDTAVLTGIHLITVSANAVIHPRARINSTYGQVTIGEGCIISEKASVGLLGAPEDGVSQDTNGSRLGVILEQDVYVEPTAIVEGQKIGQGSSLEAGSKICAGAVVGKHCKVAPLCTVPAGETLEDYTVVFGNNQRRKAQPGLEVHRKIAHDKEVQVLKKLIPTNLTKWQSSTR